MRNVAREKRRAMFAGAAIGMLFLDAALAIFTVVWLTKHPLPQVPIHEPQPET